MSKPRILIVEDETIVARDIGEQLVELGFEPVGFCSRGEEVLAEAQLQRPDLVLMDIHLAGVMDGIEAAGLLRDHLNVPVVFLTAFAETETFDRAVGSDPFGYIIKPFTPRELRTVIDIALFKHGSQEQTRQSRALLQAVLETAQEGYGLTDMAGRLLEVNAACERITGYKREELLAMSLADLDAERATTDFAGALARIATAGSIHGERQIVRRDAKVIDVEFSAQFLPDEGGRLVFFIRDITQRKARARELELKSAALAAAANAIVITDREGVITWANEAFSTLTGYALAEAVGRNPKEIIKSGQHPVGFYREMWETVLAGKVWSGELINRHKSGRLYHEAMTITPMREAGGEIEHFIAIKQDISARKAAEEKLRDSEERYRALFDNNPLPMWLYDVETLRFLAVNDTAVQKYGYSREEFLGLKITRIHPEEDVERLLGRLQEKRESTPAQNEWRHRRKDGTVFPVQVIARPLQYQGRSAWLVMAEDISEKKQLQDQFMRAQRMESLGLLASGIAHDLNNMLAPVLFTAPLLRGSVTSERDLGILNILEKSAERGTGLVRQILAFAHGSTGAPRITQVKHIARDVIEVLEVTLPKSITLESNIISDAWPVEVNPTQIHQVLLNLGVNARDAMPDGGVLTYSIFNRTLDAEAAAPITDGRSGNWLVIEVTDTGSGIPPEVLPHIWDSFFTTKGEGKGTGLGLSTVRSIVTLHQGFVQVETVVGRGTTFRIYLPASANAGAASGSAHPLPVAKGREEWILVVDDDDMIREITKAVLTQQGYRVIECADGIEAIVNYNERARDVALVITDIDMPNLNGAVLLATLRKLNPQLRIIGMSGMASASIGTEALNEVRQQANAFLAKPFSAATLLETVQQVLASKP
ncbi:MAG: PAS domain S-box protein [Cephaloticoccus sp.]|nr:PAS domain S-box protein [Cephaloticoccus sp.]